MQIQGKVIAITGAAQGLGRMMAEMIAARGGSLALIDRDQTSLAETVEHFAAAGVKLKGYQADVADDKAVESVFAAVRNDFGGLDGLINSAGITGDALLVKATDGVVQRKMSAAEFDRVVAVDLKGVFLCAREAAVHMIECRRAGVIINISSISRAGNVGQTNYAAAKAGVAAMTVTWAKELARHGIRVAGIAPGFSATRMIATIPEKVRERIVSTIPLHRFAQPEEIARGALFVLENDYFNGRTLEIDGGLRL